MRKNFVITILCGLVILQTFWIVQNQSRIKKLELSQIQLKSPTNKKFIPEEIEPIPHKGKIAIIIDDSGYNIRDCEFLKTIQTPISISILPDLRYSQTIAQCAKNFRKEVMLHLPLEAYHNTENYPEDYIINGAMSPTTIEQRFKQALASVPYAVGVNNHMGSKATEDKKLMSIIFTQIHNHHLFFVDSRVTHRSICQSLAKSRQLPFAERNIFLDNENNRSYIEGQFEQLAEHAQKFGYAIGIGHARSLTWQILMEQSTKLIQEGFEIVTVQSLIQSM